MKQTLTGEVIRVLIARDPALMRSSAEPQARVTLEGFDGDRHAGLTRHAGARSSHYPRGAEIRNNRQISIVSVEELEMVAHSLGLPELLPEWLGANLLFRAIPQLTWLPPGTRLFFPQDAVLVVDGENAPCTKAGGSIQEANPSVPGLTRAFPKAAQHLRGVIAWVERPGQIAPGDSVRAELPQQRIYQLT